MKLMVQEWKPQHFKLPVSLSFLVPQFRSLSNSSVLESHFGKLRCWLLTPFVSVNITCGRKITLGGHGYIGKIIVDAERKRKQWQFIYSLQSRVLFWCLINKSPIYFTFLTQMPTRNIFIMELKFLYLFYLLNVCFLSNKMM